MGVLNREDFNKYLQKSVEFVHLFRGIHDKKYAEKFRRGRFYIGALRGNYFFDSFGGDIFGSVIYTVADYREEMLCIT